MNLKDKSLWSAEDDEASCEFIHRVKSKYKSVGTVTEHQRDEWRRYWESLSDAERQKLHDEIRAIIEQENAEA